MEAKDFFGVKDDVRICILQRGWIMVGYFERVGDNCKLLNGNVIKSWGTDKGLGVLAKLGPQKDTQLDPNNGEAEFDWLTVVATLKCNAAKWEKALKE
jgi:hypothetical protein